MDEKIINGLQDLGYKGPLLERDQFMACMTNGPKSVEFTKVVRYLTNEIRTLLDLDEEVNEITCPEDSVAFVMELTSFLKELNCPYTSLVVGHISDRFQTIEHCHVVLDYLITELMGARILQEINPSKTIELKIQETDEAANMKKILMTLNFSKPPPNVTIQQIFQKLIPTFQQTIQKVTPDLVGTPIFCGTLSDKQWKTLNGVERDLNQEYKIRREMLLTRLDVTIQSFQWSDKTRGKDEHIERIYSNKRILLKSEPNVDISDLLAARDDIAIIEKTSSASVRRNTGSKVQKVIIGQVPDRGGRTDEIAPPPPEMPPWQQRSNTGGGWGSNRGGGGAFNRGGGGAFNRGGGGNFNRGGGHAGGFGQGRQNYDQGGQGYGGGGNYGSNNNSTNYSNKSGGYAGFDSAGSFGSNRNSGGGGYGGDSKGGRGGSYGGDSKGSRSFDSSGSYSNSYSRLANFDTSLSLGKPSYDTGYSSSKSGTGYDNKSSYDSKSGYDGKGGYDNKGGYSSERGNSGNAQRDYEQSNKRAKTYDSFQTSRTTYADQYVQDNEQNKRYNSGGRGGGINNRSNYSRGGAHSYR